MISVRIPKELRAYKEKIFFGLTVRQIISVTLGLASGILLYVYASPYIHEEVLSWMIFFVGAIFGAIGFFKTRSGMTAEKFFFAILKFFIYPPKRIYKTENIFNVLHKTALKQEDKLSKKKERNKSLENAVLLEDNEESEDEECTHREYESDGDDVLTVSTNPKLPNGKKPKKSKKDKEQKSKLQCQAEEIEEKLKADSHYLLSKKEQKVRRKWQNKLDKQHKQEFEKKKKALSKKNSAMEKRRKARLTIPKSTQQTIPFIADYDEGLFEVMPNKYSKVYRIQDINYKTAQENQQVLIFCKYCEFLNYFPEEIRFSICVDNRVISMEQLESQILYPLTGKKYDEHRREFNNVLIRQMTAGRNNIRREIYITATIDSATPIEALYRFRKIDIEIIENLRKIGSDGSVLTTEERLSYYHDKYRKGHEGDLNIDFEWLKQQGISSKDYIAPSLIEIESKSIKIEDSYYRTLHLCNLPSSLADDFLYDFCENEFPVTVTLNVESVSATKALRMVQKQLTGVKKDKSEAESKAIKSGYSPESIKQSIKDALEHAETMYDDLVNKNQKMFFVTMTCLVQGDTLDELNQNCKSLEGKARKISAQLLPLTYQQEEGYKITLPFGYYPQAISCDRTLTTESTAIFMPFVNQELYQEGGYYYGVNQISLNMILVDRWRMKTPSGFVLGSTGAGKSFAVKREILSILLHDDYTNILIIDPENEYGGFCRIFGALTLKIGPNSNVHINPLDMNETYGLDEDDPEDVSMAIKKEKALRKKSDYILSIVEQMLGYGGNGDKTLMTSVQKTIVDRCVSRCYEPLLNHDFDQTFVPTLVDLQNELDKEKAMSEEGRIIAESVEYYTRGNMNVFSHNSNVSLDNRIVVFNIRDIGEQLKSIAMIIVFDFIWTRLMENFYKRIRTYCICDEIHIMFLSYYSANFFRQLYKRGRKFGLCITGITQNVEDCIKCEQARSMIQNSEFLMIFEQKSADLEALVKMLQLSEEQASYVFGADVGSGLLKAEGVIVPFMDKFPNDSYLYKLMSTKFGEDEILDDSDISKILKQSKVYTGV